MKLRYLVAAILLVMGLLFGFTTGFVTGMSNPNAPADKPTLPLLEEEEEERTVRSTVGIKTRENLLLRSMSSPLTVSA